MYRTSETKSAPAHTSDKHIVSNVNLGNLSLPRPVEYVVVATAPNGKITKEYVIAVLCFFAPKLSRHSGELHTTDPTDKVVDPSVQVEHRVDPSVPAYVSRGQNKQADVPDLLL